MGSNAMPPNQVQRIDLAIAALDRANRLNPDREPEPMLEDMADRIRAIGLARSCTRR
jgi:hypothetical protein